MNRDAVLALLDRPATEIFGPDPAEAVRVYHRMARLLHPDTGMDGAAFTRLTAKWRAYGRGESTTITTKKHVYEVGPKLARGDLADLFEVTLDGGPAVLKLPRNAADNDLLEREAVALRQLRANGDPRFLPYVPELVESLRYEGRSGHILVRLEGFHTLAEVHDARPDGVDPRDAAWMWRRLLVALGFAHRAGVLHGAVLPEHVMIHPEQHGLVLVDWCYSVPATVDSGGRVPALVSGRASWYPPEVPGREPASPATDLFLATRCMTYLMGPKIPDPLRNFARGCTLSAQKKRPSNAWRLLTELDELLERLYGPRTFRPFKL
ncbi:serine/threonine-protein kinase [Actinocorallia populi]|uniref:protein kinase family protein n=1 Tax=Actinocorallia populi TaxID=2079200 RepID=UPI000D090795|nr:protein kinase family protein [Actinocorallia populi]